MSLTSSARLASASATDILARADSSRSLSSCADGAVDLEPRSRACTDSSSGVWALNEPACSAAVASRMSALTSGKRLVSAEREEWTTASHSATSCLAREYSAERPARSCAGVDSGAGRRNWTCLETFSSSSSSSS